MIKYNNILRPLKNVHFCSSSRKAKILTIGIHSVFRGLKFKPNKEIGQKGAFCKGLIFRHIIISACLFVLLTSCGGKTESPQKPMVITRKIIIEKTDVTSPDTEKKETVPEVPEAAPTPPKPEAKPEKEPPSEEPAATTVAYSYDPTGKIDPFLEWAEERVSPDSDTIIEVKKRVPLTPLEKLDWSQIKLVGIIRAPSGNQALVEESSGKGYVITKGSYIGTNRGVVTQILKDKVIIKEVIEYGVSDSSIQTKELILQKPPGEE